MFDISYNDYPRALSDEEAEEELSHLKSVTGLMDFSEKKIAGLDCIQITTKNGPIYQVGRFVLVQNQRLYSFQTGSTMEPEQIRVHIEKFFDSVRIDASKIRN